MRSKTYQAIKEKAPTEAVDIDTAVTFLQEHARQKFHETVEVHVRLGIDPSRSDQTVRGTVLLPAGAVKQPRITVIAQLADERTKAQQAGATVVGGEELIEAIVTSGTLDADVVIATPAMMSKIAKVAKILGPKGLMPNPKTDTVAANPAEAVKQLLSGKVSFKMDQLGNVHIPVAKLSWDKAKIVANSKAVLEGITSARPAAARGQLIKSVTIKSTMSPAVRVAYSA